MGPEDVSIRLFNNAVLLGCVWALLKWTVGRELKAISSTLEKLEKQGTGHAEDLRDLDVRVSVLEVGGGRRKTDSCPAPECPFEPTRPGHRP